MTKFRTEDCVRVASGTYKGATAVVSHPLARYGDEDIIVRVRLDSKDKFSGPRTVGVYQYRLVLISSTGHDPNLAFKRRKMGV